MNKRKLGRTHLHVSELCLNATKFGYINDEATSLALLDAYRAEGGDFIESFGSSQNSVTARPMDARSEEIVGRWHRSRAISRNSLVLATRVNLFRPTHGGGAAFANLIRESCERSLRRLQTEHLDLLVCEWDEHLSPVEDIMEAFDWLIRAGLVRHVVAAGFPSWRVIDSLHRSSLRNHVRFEALQADYSLLTRAPFEAEALAMCREHRLGFLARSPLAGGLLAKRPVSIRELINLDRSWQNQRFGSNAGDATLTVLSRIADERHASSAQVALAWVLRNPQVSSALVSARSTPELRELIGSANILLTREETSALANATAVRNSENELRHA